MRRLDPRALALPYLSELRLMMSKTVLTSSAGEIASLSLEAGCLRGMVSPFTGSYPDASTVKGPRFDMYGYGFLRVCAMAVDGQL